MAIALPRPPGATSLTNCNVRYPRFLVSAMAFTTVSARFQANMSSSLTAATSPTAARARHNAWRGPAGAVVVAG